jgi:hypothetical protein
MFIGSSAVVKTLQWGSKASAIEYQVMRILPAQQKKRWAPNWFH